LQIHRIFKAEYTMTDRVGQHFGNYQLIRSLGQGGCAQVYLGKHRYLNSYAALKVLHATLDLADEQRFRAEAQTLVDLQHPNIVRLLDFGVENGTPVLIMEYAPKGSLRHQYPRGTQIHLATVVDSVIQIAAALQYAHDHGCIHCDVKPENILLAEDNRLLLSDFGISLLTPSSEQLSTQDPAGTPRYMAPEQLCGKPCAASDQYALAILVYEWLCGDPPFQGNMWQLMNQHIYAAPPPLRTLRPDIPLTVEQIVRRALAKKPQDRFVSIQAFAKALAQAGQTSPTVDEHDPQVTTPTQDVPHSSSMVPPHQATALPLQNNPMAQIPTRTRAEVPPEPPRASAGQNQNRVRMLGRLRRTYGDLMSQSLQGAAWLELGKASRPDAVQNATHLLLHVSNRAVHHLPPGTSITQAYDEAEHELLILGEPGAGKSTLLLDLAQQLLIRAETNETHPLPVILPISTFAVKRPKLEDWIAEQMSEIYDVPRKVSMQWVQAGHILPLLDGLDEMEETARPACIATINAYHSEHMLPLVVCSRTAEYEAAAEHHRLALLGAVVVQPLTFEMVDAYLVRAGEPLTALRKALKENAPLQDLATTPLMLNILTLTYQGSSVPGLSNKETLSLQQVWDDYVRRMVTRKGKSKRYPLSQTRAWLSCLARQMREHNQTVFYLEHLQPDWLSVGQRRTYTKLGIRLPAIVIGALISILVFSFFVGLIDWSSLLRYGIVGGLLGGLWRGLAEDLGSYTNPCSHGQSPKREYRSRIRTARVRLLPLGQAQRLHAGWYQGEHHHVWSIRLAISACIGLICGLIFGFSYPSPSAGYTLGQRQIDSLGYGVVIGLGCLLLQYLLMLRFPSGVFAGKSAPRRWKWVVRFGATTWGPRALLVAVIAWLTVGLSILLIERQINGPIYALVYGLSSGISFALISLTLGAQMADIHLTERMSWTWKNMKRGLFNKHHFRITGWLICITMICFVPVYGWIEGPGFALCIVLSYWLLLGLYQGMAQERIEDQDRRFANQGIHRSLRNSVIMGTIGGAIIGSIGILTSLLILWLIWLIDRVSYDLNSFALSFGPPVGINGALLICILTGGLAIWRHYVIRWLLWRSHTLPWKAPQFLDDATARFLLRRVGGGYSFAHRLLLDHLADTEATPKASASPLPLPHRQQ
jgi:serine/threonine protein kinase